MKTISTLGRTLFATAAATLLCAPTLQADKQVSASFNLPVHVDAIVTETNCLNHPGPTVTLSGAIILGGIDAKITFKNNKKGTHETNVVAEFTIALIPEGGKITIPKQPVLGGVGGNPFIYFQFTDENGAALSGEFFLGRCVQGLAVSADLLQEAAALANVHATDCSNNKGPYITLNGATILSGLHGKFIFRNNVKGQHTAESSSDVTIIADGSTITIPKQPVKGGVGGNPLISIQFLHHNGDPIGNPTDLGRCVQL